MTRPSQKEEEHLDVKEFLEVINLDAHVEPSADPNTPPDLFLRFDDGKRIALEVTRFHSAETSPSRHPRRDGQRLRVRQ